MSKKINIYVDVENLTIDGDEFRYKYTYADIKYMRDAFAVSLSEATRKRDVFQRKIEVENEIIVKSEFSLNAMNNILDAMIAENPSLAEEEDIIDVIDNIVPDDEFIL